MVTHLRRHFTFEHTAAAIGLLSVLWVAVFSIYHLVLPMVGAPLSYLGDPVLTAAYFLAWCSGLLALYPRTLKRAYLSQGLDAYALLIAFLSFLAVFYGGVMPFFTTGIEMPPYPVDHFVSPGSAYLLPKMAEIALQQSIIVALLLLLASYRNSLIFVSIAYALIFGAAHIILLMDVGLQFTIIFGGAAMLSAIIFPYLILRVRNGIVYSFMVHWAFYLVLTLWYIL